MRTRLDLAITICKEMLKRAEEHKAKAMEAKGK